MKKSLSLILIVLLGVVLLSGCSNDSDSLSDEAEITAVVEDFENDLNILATKSSASDEYQGVDAGWDADGEITLNFQGVWVEKVDLNQFKVLFNEYLYYFDQLEIIDMNINSNTAEVNAKLVTDMPTALSNSLENLIIINFIKDNSQNKWYIDNFIMQADVPYNLVGHTPNILSNVNADLPDSDYWGEKSSSSNINVTFESEYYSSELDEVYFHSSILNSSAILIDKGKFKNNNDLESIKNNQSQAEEIKIISQSILNSLYKGYTNDSTFTIEIVEYEESEINFGSTELEYEFNIELEISSPSFLNSADRLYANYKLKVLYKNEGGFLYLAAYSAPIISDRISYYEKDIAESLIESFKIIK